MPSQNPTVLSPSNGLKVDALKGAYDAVVGMKGHRYGCTCRQGKGHGNICGRIHNREDAARISECIADSISTLGVRYTNLGVSQTLKKARQVARLIEVNTRTKPDTFGDHLPIVALLAKSIYDITSRAFAFYTDQSTKPDCDAPYYPRTANTSAFSSHLKSWWLTAKTAQPKWSDYVWSAASTSSKYARFPPPPPSPSPPPSPPTASSPPASASSQSNAGSDYQERERERRDKEYQNASNRTQARHQQHEERRRRAAKKAEEERRKADDRNRRRQERERKAQEAQDAQKRTDARNEAHRREEASRRAAEEADKARRESEEAEAENARREEEERQRNAQKQADEESRATRDRLAQELHEKDVAAQKVLFMERQADPHIPPPRPPPTPNIRSVSLPPRIPAAERALVEATRAAEIASNIASAKVKLAAATTQQLKAIAEAELDEAIANSRKFPAYPYRVDGGGPSSKLQAIDHLHPLHSAVTFVRIKRDQPLWATERLAEIQGGLADAYDTACESSNEVETDRILKFVMASVALFLRETTRKEDSLERRFNLYDKGELDTLVAEYLSDAREAEDEACSELPAQQADVLARVMHLLSKGEVSKAVAAAIPGSVNNTSDPRVLEQLKKRVGKGRTVEMPGTLDPGGKDFRRIKIEVGKAYRSLQRLKGTGPDNVPPEILSAITRHFSSNPQATAAVDLHQAIADQYLDGTLPFWFYALSSIAELIPLAKSLGSIDVRPISMTSIYARTWKAQAARQACENAESHFAEVQLGAGVRGGTVTQALGPAVYLEGAGGTESVVCLDVKNAFSSMSRSAACDALLRSSDPAIRALARVFHAANSASLRAKGIDVVIEEGGGQGCPLMTVTFAEVLQQALLNLKREARVAGVVSFLDDMTVVGPLEHVLPAVMRLADEISKLGLELNLSKCLIIPKDAAQVRSALAQLSIVDPRLSQFKLATMPGVDPLNASWGDGFGAVIAGTPVGDYRYIHYYMDKVTREALADALHVTEMLVATSGQAAIAILRQSSLTKLTHLAMTIRPAIAEPYFEMYDIGLVKQFFDVTGLMVGELTDPEVKLTMYRLRASQRSGGVGMNDLASDCRQHFVNGFTMATPRLVPRTLKGETAKGCIPILSAVLGKKFSEGEGEERWSKATSEESLKMSPTCRAFYSAYRDLQKSVATDDDTAPVTGVLATPVEAAGIEGGKPNGNVVQKFASHIAQQRAAEARKIADDVCCNIPRVSPVREAYAYSKDHSSMSGFIATCPTYSNVIGNVHLQTAMACFLGLPIRALNEHQNIRLPHSKSPIYLDPYGHNISKADGIKGTATKDRHDSFLTVLADILRTAGIPHTVEDVGAFGGARMDPSNHLPPIIPDLTVSSGDQSYFCDLKFLGPGTALLSEPYEEGTAIETRAAKVNTEYQTAAAKHDAEWETDAATTILRNHGRVRGFIVGPRGELSKDLVDLIAKAATAAGTKNWAELGEESAKLARARYLRVFRRKIALAAVRAQAIWMSSRLKQARAQNAGGSRPSQRERVQRWRTRRDHEEYASTHASFANARHRRG